MFLDAAAAHVVVETCLGANVGGGLVSLEAMQVFSLQGGPQPLLYME